jgi:hypothetical protein
VQYHVKNVKETIDINVQRKQNIFGKKQRLEGVVAEDQIEH